MTASEAQYKEQMTPAPITVVILGGTQQTEDLRKKMRDAEILKAGKTLCCSLYYFQRSSLLQWTEWMEIHIQNHLEWCQSGASLIGEAALRTRVVWPWRWLILCLHTHAEILEEWINIKLRTTSNLIEPMQKYNKYSW